MSHDLVQIRAIKHLTADLEIEIEADTETEARAKVKRMLSSIPWDESDVEDIQIESINPA